MCREKGQPESEPRSAGGTAVSRSGVKQAPLVVAIQLSDLPQNMRRRAQMLAPAAERVAMIRTSELLVCGFPQDEDWA